MSVYCTILFIILCCNACVSLYSRVSLILLNGFDRVAWLVLLFESVSDSNGFGLSVRVKISTVTTGQIKEGSELFLQITW